MIVLTIYKNGGKAGVVGASFGCAFVVVQPDQQARVVIGENVRINPIAIAQGNLTIRITETQQVSQPAPFSTTGDTVVVPRADIEVDGQAEKIFRSMLVDEYGKMTAQSGGIGLTDQIMAQLIQVLTDIEQPRVQPDQRARVDAGAR